MRLSGQSQYIVDSEYEGEGSRESEIFLKSPGMIKQTATRDVAKGVPKLVRQGSEGLKSELDAKIDALLASATQHPITYNAQLTENAQQI
ncbi:hypothetical protein VTI28DRAFT_8266 [Corynascus sepedonium]